MSTLEARQRTHVEFRKRKNDAGLCLRCPNGRLLGMTLCAPCRTDARADAKKRYYANLPLAREKARNLQREWRLKDPDRLRAYARERYKKYPDLFRGYELKQHYGITLEKYRAIEQKQHGVCALCKRPALVGKRGNIAGIEKSGASLKQIAAYLGVSH